MKNKNLVSLTIGFAFLVMSITGLLLYFNLKFGETLHIIFGLIFFGFAIFHIVNNWTSITGYSKSRKTNSIQKEFWVALGIFALFLAGGAAEIEPFKTMAHGGKILMNGGKKRKDDKLAFTEVVTNKDIKGTALSIMIQKGKDAKLPIIAIWTEDSAHNFIEPLFVPTQIVSLDEEHKNMPVDMAIREGEAIISNFSATVFPLLKEKNSSVKPNFEKASPSENFVLKTNTKATGSFYVVMSIKHDTQMEDYSVAINPKTSNIVKFQTTDKKLVTKGIIEIE
jgi:hypothetical protein